MTPQTIANIEEIGIAALLNRRYGDGLVYLQGNDDYLLFDKAIKRGLLNEEGLLTPRGFRFWQSHQSHPGF